MNRSPLAGVVADKHYVKGKFVNASLDKANRDNERLALVLDTGLAQAHKIGLVQIVALLHAGYCVMDVGDRLTAGQIYGLIDLAAGLMSGCPPHPHSRCYPGKNRLPGKHSGPLPKGQAKRLCTKAKA